MTTYPDGTIVYTPYPDNEVTDPPTGANIVRTTYRLTGQIVAVQTKVGTAGGTFYYTYTDHLGNITALSTTGGAYVTGSKARYDPFGTFTTTTPTSNPSISNHGFTGHRHNNTGTNDLDLIYMNARYYIPLVGRFISPDTIVPDPGNPQSFNRYSYIENRPLNGTDPSGHCIVAYSGDVRMNDGPYGTSGLCPNTSSWIIEGNAAISAYYQQPVPEYWLFNKMKSRLSSFYNEDANGVGILAQASIDSPIAGIELMSGQEIIHSNADNSTTRFIVIGGGVRVGPSASFVGSLKGLVKSGNPINATISPYVSGIDNVDNLVEDYSGPFTYRSTAISAEVGVTWGETKSPPNPLGNRASSEFIGPALGYALTTSYGSGVSIPLYTQSPGQLLPTIHWQKAWEVITGLWD